MRLRLFGRGSTDSPLQSEYLVLNATLRPDSFRLLLHQLAPRSLEQTRGFFKLLYIAAPTTITWHQINALLRHRPNQATSDFCAVDCGGSKPDCTTTLTLSVTG
jgi:hypothetical protein